MRTLIPFLALFLLAPAARADRTEVDSADVHAAIERAWEDVASADARLEILFVPPLRYSGEAARVDVTMPPGTIRPGPRALTVACSVDGRVVARGLANVLITVSRPVWTAPRDLTRREVLRGSELVRETREFDREPLRILEPAPDRLYVVNRSLPAGQLVRTSDVRALPDVESGQEIVLVSKTGTASIAVPARTRRSGNVGDTILVHNSVSGEIVRAVLIDRMTAELAGPNDKPSSRSHS